MGGAWRRHGLPILDYAEVEAGQIPAAERLEQPDHPTRIKLTVGVSHLEGERGGGGVCVSEWHGKPRRCSGGGTS